MFNMFKKNNKIKQRKSLIIDNENLVLGSTLSGKTARLNRGLDLYYLLLLFEGEKITITELSEQTKVIYEGNSSDYNCKKVEYEVIQFEKVHYNNSYTITVKKVI